MIYFKEYLIKNRPDYICRAVERQNILSDLANLRNERRKLKTNLLISNNFEKHIPPNPLGKMLYNFFLYLIRNKIII